MRGRMLRTRCSALPHVLVVAVALLTAACAEEDESQSLALPGSDQGGGVGGETSSSDGDEDWPDGEADLLAGACPLGATHACKVEHEAGCAAGTQYCPDGEWTGCMRDVLSLIHI